MDLKLKDLETFSTSLEWEEGNKKLEERKRLNLQSNKLKSLQKISIMERNLSLRLKDTEYVANVMDWEAQILQLCNLARVVKVEE